jgi:hypothetical protein
MSRAPLPSSGLFERHFQNNPMKFLGLRMPFHHLSKKSARPSKRLI